MGRQINFYMSETVQAEFMEFLKQNQFVYYMKKGACRITAKIVYLLLQNLVVE